MIGHLNWVPLQFNGVTLSPEQVIRLPIIESSRFQARVAKGRPAFRDHITGGKPRVQNCVSRAPASELVLQRGSLPSEIALPAETSSPELSIEG